MMGCVLAAAYRDKLYTIITQLDEHQSAHTVPHETRGSRRDPRPARDESHPEPYGAIDGKAGNYRPPRAGTTVPTPRATLPPRGGGGSESLSEATSKASEVLKTAVNHHLLKACASPAISRYLALSRTLSDLLSPVLQGDDFAYYDAGTWKFAKTHLEIQDRQRIQAEEEARIAAKNLDVAEAAEFSFHNGDSFSRAVYRGVTVEKLLEFAQDSRITRNWEMTTTEVITSPAISPAPPTFCHPLPPSHTFSHLFSRDRRS